MAKLGVRFNLLSEGMSQVSGWEFNSIGKLGTEVIAAGSGGLKQLGGEADGDAAIISTLTTPLNELSVVHPKRVRRLYAKYSAESPLTVVCSTDENEDGFTITLPATVGEVSTSKGLPGDRRIRGVNWKFTVSNKDGADFSIGYIGILFVPLTRSRSL